MTSETGRAILDAVAAMLADVATVHSVRHCHDKLHAAVVWASLEELGFADVMLPEEKGGAGIESADLCELAMLFGRNALAVPAADTIVARALLSSIGQDLPNRLIALSPARCGQDSKGEWRTGYLPLSGGAETILFACGSDVYLTPLSAVDTIADDGISRAYAATPLPGARKDAPSYDVHLLWAAIRLAEMAGMIQHIFELTLDYAKVRQQFGKPIGAFQAVQQQMSVMAQQSVAAAMAVRLCFCGPLRLNEAQVGTAAVMVIAAAQQCAAIAHAIHGAIGMTEEYELQIYTANLVAYRMALGAESLWAAAVGKSRLAMASGSSVDHANQLFTP